MATVLNYADWSINDLFCELINYCQANTEDDTTEAIKAAILARARTEGADLKYRQLKETSLKTLRIEGNPGDWMHVEFGNLPNGDYLILALRGTE